MSRILLAMMFIFSWMIPPAAPETEFETVYLPVVANNGYLNAGPATVSGRILKTDGTPYAGQIVRLAQVFCESYDPYYDCWVLLDMANDPGDCTDQDGEYTLTVRGFASDIRYSLLVVGNVERGDYQIIYKNYDDILKIQPAQQVWLGDITTTVATAWCRVQSSSPEGPLLLSGLDE